MKLVYTHENPIMVNNIKNILAQAGVETLLRNEFSQAGLGEIPAFDTWPELWVIEPLQYEKAQQLVEAIKQQHNAPAWFCTQCHEENDGSFEICWQCQHEREE
ncbi:putative signal transducing protein [Motilimonas pumila]|uniref:DUF2007 domain-containing protein n=1 Tax=Motilimonas pumila TaxID=2303987 RepID=A0A418YCL2_9GAMM|nr:DUF2007 domain-containing protein [Motilimonas pumila]RJG42243.1 DUF2007 domain-containing protein [Motilimonas pumila]